MVCFGRILCLGTDALTLYAEIHQSTVNQIIHGLGMPFVGYAIFGGVPLLLAKFRDFRDRSLFIHLCQFAIYFFYVIYYSTFDRTGSLTTAMIYAIPLVCAMEDFVGKKYGRGLFHYIKVLAASIFIQEGVGHLLFEHKSSDLWQLPNSIAIAPLFGVRCILHNFFGQPLTP